MARKDAFLKLDNIAGESQDSKHKGEIEIDAWSFQAKNGGTASHGGGQGAGVADLKDLSISKPVDKSSPLLFQHCASGKPIPKAVLVTRKAGGDQQDYLKITLTDVLVSSYGVTLNDGPLTVTGFSQPAGASAGAVMPQDQFTLNFGKIEFEYSEQKQDGSISGAVKGLWNVKTASAS